MRRVIRLVVIGVVATILVYGIYTLQDVYRSYEKSKQYAQIELQNGYQNSAELEDVALKMTEDEVGFVFWNEKKDANIMSAEFGRSEMVTALAVKGNSGCIYPNSNGLTIEDEGKCLIDETTAMKLFGSSNVIGQKIQYQEQNYIIQGLLQEKKSAFVYEPSANQNAETPLIFDHLTLKVQEGFKPVDMARKVQSLYGIE